MGLMDLFSKAKAADEQPTAVEYVEWLLLHMLRISRTELTIDSSKPLPGSDLTAKEAPPPCVPDAQAVINRLKILSGVNPVCQAKAVRGSFERSRTHHTIEVATQFQDSAEKSDCSIRLRIRFKNA